jgi:hypothetical protein
MVATELSVATITVSLQRGFFTPYGAPLKTPQSQGTDPNHTMRAEIEHLVEETKQSVGLLRRHL